jgi:PilZ domain
MPLVFELAGRSLVATTEDIGVGGLGARCDSLPPDNANLALLFNLPTGTCVRTEAIVRYVLPSRFGVEFTTLAEEARDALDEYTKRTLGYVRRGGRTAKRYHVTLRSAAYGHPSEHLAETVILNHFGGRLICRAQFKAGETVTLCWPEKHRQADVRIVHRESCGPAGLVELGFEFVDVQDFWGAELGN